MSFLHIGMTQVFEILPYVRRQGPTYFTVYIIPDDCLVTQGAKASATMTYYVGYVADYVEPNEFGPRTSRVNDITCMIIISRFE